MNSRISRRAVVRGGAFGITGLAAAALIGCGDDDEAASSPGATSGAQGSNSTQAPATVQRSGTLLLRDTPQTQDLHRQTGTMPFPSLVADTPTAIDADGATQMFLMDSFEAPDASNYTLTFKPGVKFHNGRELVAEDVKLNFERIAATEGAWLQSVTNGIESVESPDDRTVVVKLATPYSPMLSLLSEMWLLAPESPGWDGTITAPIGTGPFMWNNWVPNDRIYLDAFADYWRAGLPKIAKVEVKNLEGDSVPPLLAGDIHISGIGVSQREMVGSNSDIQLQLEKATSWQFLSFNNRAPRAPFDDIRVRQALGHALDKAALNEFANGDTGQVADQMAPPNSFYWSADIVDPFAKPDLQKARDLLSAAGIAEGSLKPVMPVNSDPTQSEVVAAQLREIGVEPSLEVADDVTTELRLQEWNWDIYYAGSGTRSDIALRFVRMMSDGPNPGLWGGPQDPEYDAFVREAWAAVDPEERREHYLEAWKVVMDKLFTIVVYHKANTTAIRKEVQGWETGAMANFNRIDGGASHISLT